MAKKNAEDSKKSFILYCDYRDHLQILTDEQCGKLFLALMDYAATGTEPELDGAALMAFSFIRSQMDRDAAQYAKTCKSRSEAGKKGGRPPKTKDSDGRKNEPDESTEKQTKTKKANGFSENQSEAKKGDNDNDNDHDNDHDNYIIPPIPPKGETRTDAKPDAQERRFDEFWQQYPKKVGKKAAQTAWKRLKPDADLHDRIMHAVALARTSEQWNREGGRFIPNPATWINQGRWDDEPAPVTAQQPQIENKKQASQNPFLAMLEGAGEL